MLADKLIKDLKDLADEKQSVILSRFFKTGKGQYGKGDIFWGIKVPVIRESIKKYYELDFIEIEKLIQNPVHEVRLAGLLMLVKKFDEDPQNSFDIYLRNTKWINNWDLVDLTAPHIIGKYLWNLLASTPSNSLLPPPLAPPRAGGESQSTRK